MVDILAVPTHSAEEASSSGNSNNLQVLALILKNKAWKNGQLGELAQLILDGTPLTRENATDITLKEWNKILQSSASR